MNKEKYESLLLSKIKVRQNKLSSIDIHNIEQRSIQAETLLQNGPFADFFIERKFEIMDELSNIQGNAEEDNQRRIKLSIELNALNNLKATIKAAIKVKDNLVRNNTPNL